MPIEAVLDASALLALLQAEPGAARVAATLPGARISAVNLAEVVGKLAERGMPEPMIRRALAGLGLVIVPVDAEQAWRIGALRPRTRAAGLALGDRACLALAASLDLPAWTADRAWAGVEVGVRVEVVRE